MTARSLLSLACFAAAGVWPVIVSELEIALMSPLQRAMREAFCGSHVQAGFELLGHCAACWTGSTILIAAGWIVLASGPVRSAKATTR